MTDDMIFDVNDPVLDAIEKNEAIKAGFAARRVSLEDSIAKSNYEYETFIKPLKEANAIKKKAAAEELIALGLTQESAYLIANYHEEIKPVVKEPKASILE